MEQQLYLCKQVFYRIVRIFVRIINVGVRRCFYRYVLPVNEINFFFNEYLQSHHLIFDA